MWGGSQSWAGHHVHPDVSHLFGKTSVRGLGSANLGRYPFPLTCWSQGLKGCNIDTQSDTVSVFGCEQYTQTSRSHSGHTWCFVQLSMWAHSWARCKQGNAGFLHLKHQYAGSWNRSSTAICVTLAGEDVSCLILAPPFPFGVDSRHPSRWRNYNSLDQGPGMDTRCSPLPLT